MYISSLARSEHQEEPPAPVYFLISPSFSFDSIFSHFIRHITSPRPNVRPIQSILPALLRNLLYKSLRNPRTRSSTHHIERESRPHHSTFFPKFLIVRPFTLSLTSSPQLGSTRSRNVKFGLNIASKP